MANSTSTQNHDAPLLDECDAPLWDDSLLKECDETLLEIEWDDAFGKSPLQYDEFGLLLCDKFGLPELLNLDGSPLTTP